jgi:dephospho-CoA kinase
MIKVGVTGGIGSGKTLVCRVFNLLGVPVYNADLAAAKLTASDSEIKLELTELLGPDIYSASGLNRELMAALIFDNRKLLKQVNQIIHPRVALDFASWCTRQTNQAYIIQESAILFESLAYKGLDKYITVTCPEKIRIMRVITRPGMTLEKIRRILKNQWPERKKTMLSHYLVRNDGNALILPQVLKIHDEMISIKPL